MNNLYAEISKTDDEQRLVYGYASTEALDAQGEIVKSDALKDALPEYIKIGNVREMHQPSAVGVAKSATMDDKGLYLEAKIVDDSAWKKVKEGVYKGFSIGGKALSKADGVISKMRLTEISLVDRPANPEAVIELFKADDIQPADSEIKKYAGEEAYDAQTAMQALTAIYQLFARESEEMDEPPEQLEHLKQVIDHLKQFIASEIMEPGEHEETEPEEEIQMSSAIDDLAKMLNDGSVNPDELLEIAKGLTDKEEPGDEIKKIMADLDILKSENEAMVKKIAELEAKPEPMKGSRAGFTKADDSKLNQGPTIDDVAERIAKSANPVSEFIKHIHNAQQ